ncbi:MAG TPA: T9SS type A sorting domain-containing protein [Ignavibacteriaceae bacterium]|nr:T9SS type A sorting domain-containing protein [Ignavibacteriaceae bacterium]
MKNIFFNSWLRVISVTGKLLFLVIFLFTNILLAQDWIKDYPGIPIETELWWGWSNNTKFPGAIDSMKEAGINILRAPVSFSGLTDEMQLLLDNGFVIIPTSSLGYNWIAHYTDAKYSAWEAEGNPNYDANLIHYDSVMAIDNSGTYLKLRSERAGDADTLIKGPYYIQDVHYYSSQNGKQDTIIYTANFKLKLEPNTLIPDTIIQTDNPSDTICIIQVTQSYASTAGGVWHLPCTYIIEDSVLTRGINFDTLNVWKEISLRYTLECDSCRDAPTQTHPPLQARFSFSSTTATDPPPRFSSQYIQFKVLWKKNPNYLISIDKVIISDDRGLLLKSTTIPEDQILTQATSLDSYHPLVTGWLGVDEPISIDIFEPIRMVTEILDYNSNEARPLYLPWMGMWDGVWENRANPFGAMGKSHWSEFKKRVGRANIIQDFYLYDYPYLNNGNPCYCTDYRADNIWRMCKLNYKQAYQLDPNFGVSLQCGEIHYTSQAEERNNSATEFLYNANLALMYGAKFFSLYTYFAQSSQDSCYTSGLTCHAIVDFFNQANGDISLIYTEKYNTLRYKLNPRLKGLMGKTLKKLMPTLDSLNINPSVNQDQNLYNIKKIKLDYGNPTEAMNSHIDLGFFSKEGFEPNRYFMFVNRYYSDTVLNKFKIDFRNLAGFYNWSLMNYVDSSNTTIIANESGFVTSPQFQINSGDAILFSLFPVVEFGGKLLVSEGVGDGMTLSDDMTIESGATLIVNGTYNANANITVKSGGKIVAGQNAMINFGSGKKLIVEGIVEIKGTSENNNLSIVAGAEQAVLVKSGSAFTLNYCTILAPHTGIETETGIQSYVNISNTQITATRTGISLIGGSQENRTSSTPPSMIYKCNITTSLFYGISVANFTSILVKENTLVSCGMSISNVAAAFIQSNNISLGTNLYQPGIFFNNSGGYIRNNTIKNRVNGIHLGNSSPDIGGNLIEYNYLHGIYNSSGSFPNLIGLIQTSPPTYFPLAGYNTIKNNGNDTRSGGSNDGSEIYFNYSDAHLGTERNPGCNQISDDRTATSSMTTIWLLNGYYANEPHFLDAIYNYWGTTTPTGSRFGIATNFTPYTNSLCAISGGGAEEKILLKTSSGIVVDTIYSAEGVPENLTTLEIIYSEADNLFATGNLTQSKPIYEQIVNANYTTEEKLPAYNKLYTIANLNGADETYFNSLQSIFNDIANTETDTLLKKIYNQNAIKCDLSKQEYLTAINKFDNIIQQNPNSEEAVYAEIDIITTALNLDTTNSQLGKMGNGKYLVKGTSDYLTKLNNILQSKFGINSEEGKQIIPKEYSLYQNYPNPFNPTTTIKFDIPASLNPSQGGTLRNVTLKVYDILGREIVTLVDEPKNEGRYEVIFNASSLASGVYIYKLQADDYINSKKMLLVK